MSALHVESQPGLPVCQPLLPAVIHVKLSFLLRFQTETRLPSSLPFFEKEKRMEPKDGLGTPVSASGLSGSTRPPWGLSCWRMTFVP